MSEKASGGGGEMKDGGIMGVVNRSAAPVSSLPPPSPSSRGGRGLELSCALSSLIRAPSREKPRREPNERERGPENT